ncbi:TPA: hypothetical protein DEP90_00395 [Patescibacteria group bacterium]|nr:hypothetical protein [Patescibacteria group bacterium]
MNEGLPQVPSFEEKLVAFTNNEVPIITCANQTERDQVLEQKGVTVYAPNVPSSNSKEKIVIFHPTSDPNILVEDHRFKAIDGNPSHIVFKIYNTKIDDN